VTGYRRGEEGDELKIAPGNVAKVPTRDLVEEVGSGSRNDTIQA
jgi:hypothetical protein